MATVSEQLAAQAARIAELEGLLHTVDEGCLLMQLNPHDEDSAAPVLGRAAEAALKRFRELPPAGPASEEAAPASYEKLRDAFAEYLQGHLYVCSRDESAWGWGTMSLSDFSPAEEDETILAELVAIATSATQTPAL